MKPNVGSADKIVRVLVAIAAVVIALIVGAGSALGIVLWIVAAVMVLTALTGMCPLYKLFGITTCRVDRSA